MKITYTPNPLNTVVELEPHEIELLRLRLKIEQYEEMIFSAHHALTAGLDKDKASAEAAETLDPNHWCCDEPSRLDGRVDELLQHYLDELRGAHAGDCTAFAAPCLKCHAEDLLGIDTLVPYPGKAALHRIHTTFSRWDPTTKEHSLPPVTLDDAISRLDGDARAYLLRHRATHLTGD